MALFQQLFALQEAILEYGEELEYCQSSSESSPYDSPCSTLSSLSSSDSDTKWTRVSNIVSWFYILLIVHHVMILGKWSTWRTIIFYVFIYIFNSLHVSSTSCSSSGETNCVNTTSGSCQSVSVAVSCAGQKFTSDLLKTRPPTQIDSYQRLYWHNLSLLMMSTMFSKHIES
jgi:hypothetical protein